MNDEANRPVSIRDLAKATNLSSATVSLALRDNRRISESTRKRVLEAAQRLGYRPNPVLASYWSTLRYKRVARYKAIIAVLNDHGQIANFSESPWLRDLFAAVKNRADRLGYSAEEFNIAGEDASKRRKKLSAALGVLRTRGINAVLIPCAAHASLYADNTELLKDFTVAFIRSEYSHTNPKDVVFSPVPLPFHRANLNYYFNMIKLLNQLRGLGYERPGYWPSHWQQTQLGGEALAAFHLWTQRLPPRHRCKLDWTWEPLAHLVPVEVEREKFGHWLAVNRPDVIICEHFGVKAWLEETGLKIPSDIGLAHPSLGLTEPDWTGIDPQVVQVAAAGVDLLVDAINRNERGLPKFPKDVRITGTWVEGVTTRRLAYLPSCVE